MCIFQRSSRAAQRIERTIKPAAPSLTDVALDVVDVAEASDPEADVAPDFLGALVVIDPLLPAELALGALLPPVTVETATWESDKNHFLCSDTCGCEALSAFKAIEHTFCVHSTCSGVSGRIGALSANCDGLRGSDVRIEAFHLSNGRVP